MTNLIPHLRRVIIANECGGDTNVALKFSDPDGVRSGKSGWSFGLCQFDLSNNHRAAQCLSDCGFSTAEIDGLKEQTIDPKPLEARLRDHADTIERYDSVQFAMCISWAVSVLGRHDIDAADDTAILAAADYENQFHISDRNEPGYLVHYLVGLKRPFTAQDILDFRLTTKYGRQNPGDCHRRHNNIVRIATLFGLNKKGEQHES